MHGTGPCESSRRTQGPGFHTCTLLLLSTMSDDATNTSITSNITIAASMVGRIIGKSGVVVSFRDGL